MLTAPDASYWTLTKSEYVSDLFMTSSSALLTSLNARCAARASAIESSVLLRFESAETAVNTSPTTSNIATSAALFPCFPFFPAIWNHPACLNVQ